MTSTDGFCSVVMFSPGELGDKYTGPIPSCGAPTPTSTLSTPIIPTSTPSTGKMVQTTLPPMSPTQSNRRASSPSRSASASSINTMISGPSTTMNNPTPTVGAIPGVATTVAGVPMTTPPHTPMSSSGSSSVLGKRDEAPTPAAKSESGSETSTPAGDQAGGDKKRRRIAPTLVSEPGR